MLAGPQLRPLLDEGGASVGAVASYNGSAPGAAPVSLFLGTIAFAGADEASAFATALADILVADEGSGLTEQAGMSAGSTLVMIRLESGIRLPEDRLVALLINGWGKPLT